MTRNKCLSEENWCFGVELVTSSMPSFTGNEEKFSLQSGLTPEYYFAKQ
jgi:hypothetical protein